MTINHHMNFVEKPIYHITHINNLMSISEKGGLYCDAQSINHQSVSYPAIKERRRNKEAPFFPGLFLSDFVPFYFTNRSPMLYAIHTKCVPDCMDGQESIIYFVATISTILNYTQDFCFTDGHSVEEISNFYRELSDLDKIDWQLINDWSWHNTPEDNDKKRRKQAEFLVKSFVPLQLFDRIVVYNDEIKRKVESLFSHCSMSIEENNDWYY